jgi:hypothetical protein
MMVEKENNEIEWMGELRRRNEDEANSKKIDARIKEGDGRWMTGSRNIDERQRRSVKIEECIAGSRGKLRKVGEVYGKWNAIEE